MKFRGLGLGAGIAVMYRILNNPQIYDFIQRVFTVGRTKALKVIEALIQTHSHGRVLEIGCGTGCYTHLFSENHYGLDLNLEYARSKSIISGAFVCADAVSLPFADNVFDTVFSVSFFHHINLESTKMVLKEMVRVSTTEATIVVVDCFYPENKFDAVGRIVSKLDRGGYVKQRESFTRELEQYFSIVRCFHIDYGYPYNLYAFVLRLSGK